MSAINYNYFVMKRNPLKGVAREEFDKNEVFYNFFMLITFGLISATIILILLADLIW